MRLGVYADLVYRSDGRHVSTDRAFVEFVARIPPRVDEVVLFGRLDPRPGASPHRLPSTGVRLVPLPHYPSLFAVGDVVRVLRRSVRTFAAALDELDAVWLFGPHPLAVAFAAVARRRTTPVVLGVRQDYVRYVAHRLPGRGWLWAVPAAWVLERAFRAVAGRAPTVVAGSDLARRYSGGDRPVHVARFSLVRASDVATADRALARSWRGNLLILSVGRLEPEKNPFLLVEVLARLRRHDRRWRLIAVGDGWLRGRIEQRAAELGVADALELTGYVGDPAELRELYERSQVFLHVSLTEGVPQVLFDAQAAGLPIVATDVGGVREALAGGRRGLLVPPGNSTAAAAALERIRDDEPLRRRLVTTALAGVRNETMEAELDRLVAFLRSQTGGATDVSSSQ